MTLTSALQRNPVLMSAIAHISFAQVLTPYVVAFGAYPAILYMVLPTSACINHATDLPYLCRCVLHN